MVEFSSVKPEDVGLNRFKLDKAFSFLQKEVEAGHLPGAVALVLRNGAVAGGIACGYAVLEPERIPMNMDTIFDIASVSKPVAGATSIMLLVEEGLIHLNDTLARFGFNVPAEKQMITLRQLLTHTSGMPSIPRFHYECEDRAALLKAIFEAPMAYSPGTSYLYSSLGYQVLTEIVEIVTSVSFGTFVKERILKPLNMKNSIFNPPESWKPKIAATEYSPEKGINDWGVVNAKNVKIVGGESAVAGLFSSAPDLGRYAEMLLSHGTVGDTFLLSPLTIQEMTRNHTPDLHVSRALGWWLNEPGRFGDLVGSRGFGHTGSSGTAIWLLPKEHLTIILLTNAIHPSFPPSKRSMSIERIRPIFYNLAAAAVQHSFQNSA